MLGAVGVKHPALHSTNNVDGQAGSAAIAHGWKQSTSNNNGSGCDPVTICLSITARIDCSRSNRSSGCQRSLSWREESRLLLECGITVIGRNGCAGLMQKWPNTGWVVALWWVRCVCICMHLHMMKPRTGTHTVPCASQAKAALHCTTAQRGKITLLCQRPSCHAAVWACNTVKAPNIRGHTLTLTKTKSKNPHAAGVVTTR
jgi:hypothetical protein